MQGWLEMERLLSRAQNEKTPIEIIYMSSQHTFTKRKVIVNMVQPQYVYAYCFLRKQYRRFKIANILSAMPAKLA